MLFFSCTSLTIFAGNRTITAAKAFAELSPKNRAVVQDIEGRYDFFVSQRSKRNSESSERKQRPHSLYQGSAKNETGEADTRKVRTKNSGKTHPSKYVAARIQEKSTAVALALVASPSEDVDQE